MRLISLFLAPLGHTLHSHNPICSRGGGRVSTASPSALPVCDPALGRQQLLPPTAHKQELHLGQVNIVPLLPTSTGQNHIANPVCTWGFSGFFKLRTEHFLGQAAQKQSPFPKMLPFQRGYCLPIPSLCTPEQLQHHSLGEEHTANCLVLNTFKS